MLEIIGVIGRVLERIIPDPSKRIEAEAAIQKALIENQGVIYGAMKDVMAADAASESWMTRNARPAVVFWSLGVITLIVILSPFGHADGILDALKKVPSELYTLMTGGIGLYMFGRSAEKAATTFKK